MASWMFQDIEMIVMVMSVSYLHLHWFFNTRWNLYVFDFITQAADSPLIWRLVDGVDDVGIKGLPFLENQRVQDRRFKIITILLQWHTHQTVLVLVSYPEHFIQCEFAQFRTHCGLCKLSHSIFWILYTITSLDRQKWSVSMRRFHE